MQNTQVGIVTPVLNDSASLQRLVQEIDGLDLPGHDIHVIAIDDGSYPHVRVSQPRGGRGTVRSVRSVRLACNLGHQRAIATGLVAATRLKGLHYVLVMDSDGEDRPEDVAALLHAGGEAPSCIVLAERAKRSESLGFRLFYRVYQLIFRMLTGQRITSGNFCLLPIEAVNSLIHNPSIWNNLAATVIRSRIPLRMLPTTRGRRYVGSSRMGFVGLAVHGLSAISVYTDVALVRIIVSASCLAGLVMLVLPVVVGIRLFTGLAIPGWASFMAVSLVILLFQALLFAGVAVFQLLSFRSMTTFIPALHAEQFLLEPVSPLPQQPSAVRVGSLV
jgi:hypothetical protein